MSSKLKTQVQDCFRRWGIYHRLKASWIYDLYWTVADRRVLQKRNEEIEFYRTCLDGLRSGDLIFDVGANQGFKTDMFLRLGARVVAVDPDESNQGILRQKFLKWRLGGHPVAIVGQALGNQVGVETMWVNEPGSAKNTLNVKWVETLNEDKERFGERLGFGEKRQVQVTTLEELFRAHGRPYYIKIDVEGYEATVLQGLQSAVPLLSFEVNLPEFRPEAHQCLDLLNRIDPQSQWNFIADCAGGMSLPHWVCRDEMASNLDTCNLPTIEIFWRSPTALKRLRAGPAF